MSYRRRIYIAGPMRGHPEHNFPAFYEAEAFFRASDWEVVNPVRVGEIFGNSPNTPGAEYLREDLALLIRCDAIALLHGWESSTGARCEAAVAVTLGLKLFSDDFFGGFLQVPTIGRITIAGGYEQPPGRIDTFESLQDDVVRWQRETFTQRSAHSIATHLLREAGELHKNPTDAAEMADLLLLLIGAADFSDVNLVEVAREKLERNKARTWGEPDADGVVSHVAEGAA